MRFLTDRNSPRLSRRSIVGSSCSQLPRLSPSAPRSGPLPLVWRARQLAPEEHVVGDRHRSMSDISWWLPEMPPDVALLGARRTAWEADQTRTRPLVVGVHHRGDLHERALPPLRSRLCEHCPRRVADRMRLRGGPHPEKDLEIAVIVQQVADPLAPARRGGTMQRKCWQTSLRENLQRAPVYLKQMIVILGSS